MKTVSRRARGIFFLVTGFFACPCHLAVTLPILLTLTAGTAFGAFLSNNVWLIAAMASVYFIGGDGVGAARVLARRFTQAHSGFLRRNIRAQGARLMLRG